MAPVCEQNHLLSMTNDDRGVWHQRVRRGTVQFFLALFPILLLGLVWAAQLTPKPASSGPRFVDPLPQDTGASGLQEALLRLRTTAHLMQTVAHPDDEDGGMLTLESRGQGATVLLLTLNRGEGGQNKVGSNLFDVLGVLRTLELLGADRYYGVEQRFTRVADFGFSKTAEETFQKWQGHDIALGDMVRVIRTFRPDVLVARFSGTDRDGHGHHQASSILTREAFRAAADPTRFPEQIKEGLRPWQAKKLYIGNVCGFGAQTCPAENYTVKLNVGEQNARLGMSYIQFALEGLRHQLSQGAGGWSVDPGPRYTYYKLVDSVLPSTTDKDGHEQGFFDGIDTSLPGLASRLGAEQSKAPFLRPALVEIANDVQDATQRSEKEMSDAAGPLLVASQSLDSLISRVDSSQITSPLKEDLLETLREKQQQMQTALNLAMLISVEATVAPPLGVGTGGSSRRVGAGPRVDCTAAGEEPVPGSMLRHTRGGAQLHYEYLKPCDRRRPEQHPFCRPEHSYLPANKCLAAGADRPGAVPRRHPARNQHTDSEPPADSGTQRDAAGASTTRTNPLIG